MTARNLAKRIATSMISKKGGDVAIMDLRGLSGAADYFVLCTADSDVQARSIADIIEEDARSEGEYVWHTEGRTTGLWVIQDFVNVVAHVFHREARSFYSLERLWADAKITHVHDTPPKKPPGKRKKAASATKRKNA